LLPCTVPPLACETTLALELVLDVRSSRAQLLLCRDPDPDRTGTATPCERARHREARHLHHLHLHLHICTDAAAAAALRLAVATPRCIRQSLRCAVRHHRRFAAFTLALRGGCAAHFGAASRRHSAAGDCGGGDEEGRF